MTKTIVLVHGAWLNSKSWEGFKARYEAKGFNVIAPDWPYDNRSPAELRAAPHPQLARTGQREIINHFEHIIRALPEEPILIGHSLGGVITQHLLDRGLGLGLAAAILIDVLVVRMVVAPAVMTLLGDRAWTLPAWLDRVLPRISLEGDLHDQEPAPEPTGPERKRRAPGRPAEGAGYS